MNRVSPQDEIAMHLLRQDLDQYDELCEKSKGSSIYESRHAEDR